MAIAVTAAACGSASASTSTHRASGIVRTAQNAGLGAKVLVNAKGMTLYTLSAETNGRFICTKSCLQLWKPVLAKGAIQAGGLNLGTVVRSDGGGTQLTYMGRPLYTFANDHAPGDASGNGFKDVGTWHAATVGAAAAAATAPATTGSTGSSGGGYGY
jgi:predicted lipoprotein with Yx(FWY)xxD motif